MTPETVLKLIGYALASWGALAVIGALFWWRLHAPARKFPRLFPSLDQAEQEALQRGDTRAIGRFRKLRREQLHQALGRAGK